ncbi:10433_t:CDS:2 [Ambispora gerdemannii]|uniref:10433_t:CDS:1 n=1 Tax=Ambispora gerdemannii TaxID=144530 RepID=A0A9N9CBB3_9GLOM|nr:10433_t:CDS:2 [Ambispora gerdemannii]
MSSVSAHFKFLNPPPRSTMDITIPPCAGANEVNTTSKLEFPIKGQVTVSFGDGNGKLNYYFAKTSNDTFMPVSESPVIVAMKEDENQKFNPTTILDLSKANASIGQDGVIQAVYKSDDGNTTWYECADVKVVSTSAKSVISNLRFMWVSILVIVGVLSI